MVTNADKIELMETSPQLNLRDNFKLKQDPQLLKLVEFFAADQPHFPVLECFEGDMSVVGPHAFSNRGTPKVWLPY